MNLIWKNDFSFTIIIFIRRKKASANLDFPSWEFFFEFPRDPKSPKKSGSHPKSEIFKLPSPKTVQCSHPFWVLVRSPVLGQFIFEVVSSCLFKLMSNYMLYTLHTTIHYTLLYTTHYYTLHTTIHYTLLYTTYYYYTLHTTTYYMLILLIDWQSLVNKYDQTVEY